MLMIPHRTEAIGDAGSAVEPENDETGIAGQRSASVVEAGAET